MDAGKTPATVVWNTPRIVADPRCRYITRPTLASERVQTNAAGQVVLKLKTPWRDGTTHLVLGQDTSSPLDCLCQPKGPSSARARPARLSPLEFMQLRIELPLCGNEIHRSYVRNGSRVARRLADFVAAKPTPKLRCREAAIHRYRLPARSGCS